MPGLRWIVGVSAYCELASLAKNEGSFPKNSVFAVDFPDGSREFLKKRGRTVLYSEERRGKARAVSRIIEYSRRKKCEAIVFAQGDNLFAENSFSALADCLSKNKSAGICVSKIVPIAPAQGLAGFFGKLNWGMHNYFGDKGFPKAGELFIAREKVLPKSRKGLPKGTINDDSFIQANSEALGFSTLYCPESRVFVKVPETIPEIISQRARIARGHFHLTFSGRAPPTARPLARLNAFFSTAPGLAGFFPGFFNSVISALLEIFSVSLGFLLFISDRFSDSASGGEWARIESAKVGKLV